MPGGRTVLSADGMPDMKKRILVLWIGLVAVAGGLAAFASGDAEPSPDETADIVAAMADHVRGFWMADESWEMDSKTPQTKLSDLGVSGFMSYARVAPLDEKLSAQLERVKTKMSFLEIPESVTLQKTKIPATLAESADYLSRNVCMAFPPILCTETEDVFYFSGGTSTEAVYDFSSGIAIMKADGAIWTWNHVEEGQEKPAAE